MNVRDRADHWVRAHLVPRELTFYEARRVVRELELKGLCLWCHAKRAVLGSFLVCPVCDLTPDPGGFDA